MYGVPITVCAEYLKVNGWMPFFLFDCASCNGYRPCMYGHLDQQTQKILGIHNHAEIPSGKNHIGRVFPRTYIAGGGGGGVAALRTSHAYGQHKHKKMGESIGIAYNSLGNISAEKNY